MALDVRVQAQPIRKADRWESRNVVYDPNYGGGFPAAAESGGFTVPAPVFTILQDTPNEIRVPLSDGSEEIYPLGLPRRNVRLPLEQVQADAWKKLDQILRLGRPVSFGAWFDEYTQWMSHFGGIDTQLKGVAEIGYCANSQVIRRDSSVYSSSDLSLGDHAPHWMAGANAMISPMKNSDANWLPKIVPGMIGGAILCESGYRFNRATRRFSSSTITLGNQIWQASAGATIQVGLSAPDPFGNLGSAHFIDAIQIKPPTAPATYPSDFYVETGNQTVLTGTAISISVWARGSGYFTLGWVEATVAKFQNYFLLTSDWQQFTVSGNTTATTGRVRIYSSGNVASQGTQIQTAAIQIEDGAGPSTSFMNYNVAPSTPITDCIAINESLNPHGWTFVCWFKYRNDDDSKTLLFYQPDSSSTSRFQFYVRGDDVYVEDTSGSNVEFNQVLLGIANGTWVQLAIVRDAPVTTSPHYVRDNVYVNGVLKGSVTGVVRSTNLSAGNLAPPFLFIGGDNGLSFANAFGGSANMPIDSARIDQRPWTAAEVLIDYEVRSDPGMRVLLAAVQGRYFRPSYSRSPTGPYTDIQTGELDLQQVDVRRCTVP